MTNTEYIVNRLVEKYAPLSIIVYGSFADETETETSDFDALVIVSSGEKLHDVSMLGTTRLDVFVTTREYIDSLNDYSELVQLHDGKVVYDCDDYGRQLCQRVTDYISNLPRRSDNELGSDVEWCVKMLERAKRADAEGMYRWHWLLVDSLQIYFEVIDIQYFGPKKALRLMRSDYPESYQLYTAALSNKSYDKLADWIEYVETAWKMRNNCIG